ncbi:MAG: phosphodiester glycosidase family protein [Defluviitaleaceae bacterium]|nr:phosphodiester glycosidase family protein [Defluviitaleaceae bacterium]
MKKGILFFCVVAAVMFLPSMTAYASAIDIFFEHRVRQEISRGVVYEQSRMMTSRGMLDVHVLIVDLDEPYVTLAPVSSSRELGLRETTSRLLSDAEAVAGVNADFFTTARIHSTYFGPMVQEGQLLSLNAWTNANGLDFATFFLDKNNNPFFMYMLPTMWLYANGVPRINVVTYNSIGVGMYSPMVVSRAAMYDTAAIDERIPNLTKFVVENNIVTRISAAGQTVQTPENGFVILVPPDRLPYYQHYFDVGTFVYFRITTDLNVDFTGIQSAIGGGAVILANGQLVPNRGVAPSQRHPRTAVGATRDGRIVLMVVDGRTHSIGVTHAELGAILQHYGVVNAMHMDGGGSSTMVTSSASGVYSVANLPSDPGNTQRRVINALGVFDNSPVGEMIDIVLEPAETRAVAGVPVQASVFGVDAFGNRIPLGTTQEPTFLAVPSCGFWSQGSYTPLRTGVHQIEVWYGAFIGTAEIYAYSLGELQPRQESISLMEGGRTRLSFTGTATDGTQVNIPEVTGLTVSPTNLGFFQNGYFIATGGGSGYIAAAVGAIRAYIPVTVGGFPQEVNMFGASLNSLSVPAEYVSTRVYTETIQERTFLRLEYSFGITERTQAAYATFYPAIAISGEPIALRLQVFGDGSEHWLRGRVRDGNGQHHNIDFARVINFVGWESVTAMLPNAPAPFHIDQIYMVALESNEPSSHTVVFHSLQALYAPATTRHIPQGTVFQDRLRAPSGFAGIPAGPQFQFEIPNANDEVSYGVQGVSNFTVVTMTAQGGGIQSGGIEQWRNFMPNIRALNLPYVVILLDANPLTFSRRMEFELFHLAMTELRDEGRTVFVVSATANETTLTMRDNIRYINLARPEEDEGAAVIHFRTENERVWWSD